MREIELQRRRETAQSLLCKLKSHSQHRNITKSSCKDASFPHSSISSYSNPKVPIPPTPPRFTSTPHSLIPTKSEPLLTPAQQRILSPSPASTTSRSKTPMSSKSSPGKSSRWSATTEPSAAIHSDDHHCSYSGCGRKKIPNESSELASEDYIAELEKFRQENPTLFFHEFKKFASILPIEKSSSKEQGPQVKSIMKDSSQRFKKDKCPKDYAKDDFYRGGYFRVNQQLHIHQNTPTRVRFYLESNEDDNEGPVKITIPKSSIRNDSLALPPRQRWNYDPGDSVNLSEYLHKGYEPNHAASKSRQMDSVSLRNLKPRNGEKALHDVLEEYSLPFWHIDA